MKKTLLAILLMGLPLVSVAQTDPCAGKKYAYRYLDSHCNLSYHCAENPNSDNAPLIPVRWTAGAVIKYSTSDFSNFSPCVVATKLNTCIDHAFCNWLANCPPSITTMRLDANVNDPTIIPIKAKITNDLFFSRHEFGEDDPTIQQTIAVTHAQPGCDGSITPTAGDRNHSSWIDINQTSTYTAVSTDVYPCPSISPSCKNNPVDICEAITHEIGHLFGLEHTTPGPNENIPNCDYSSPQDIMYPYVGAQPGACTGLDPVWSDNDKCMFRKLYCYGNTDPLRAYKGKNMQPLDVAQCGASGVDEGTLTPTFDPNLVTYPNPTTGELTIEYTSDRIGMVAVGIFDVLGHQMLTTSYREQAGRDSHNLDLSALPGGHYIVRVLGANLRGSRLVILTRK